MLLVRLLVNDRLLAVKFGGVQSYTWSFDCAGIGTPNPCFNPHRCSRSTVIDSWYRLVPSLGETAHSKEGETGRREKKKEFLPLMWKPLLSVFHWVWRARLRSFQSVVLLPICPSKSLGLSKSPVPLKVIHKAQQQALGSPSCRGQVCTPQSWGPGETRQPLWGLCRHMGTAVHSWSSLHLPTLPPSSSFECR